MKKPYVYMMTNKPRGTLCIGVTSDLIQRVRQYRNGLTEGFSKRYGLKMLVWMEPHGSMENAIAREKNMKRWNRCWKIQLIEQENPSWRDLYPEIL